MKKVLRGESAAFGVGGFKGSLSRSAKSGMIKQVLWLPPSILALLFCLPFPVLGKN
jgi:hypothetical protein